MLVHIIGSLGVFVVVSIPLLVICVKSKWDSDQQWKDDCLETDMLMLPRPEKPVQSSWLLRAFIFSLVIVVCSIVT